MAMLQQAFNLTILRILWLQPGWSQSDSDAQKLEANCRAARTRKFGDRRPRVVNADSLVLMPHIRPCVWYVGTTTKLVVGHRASSSERL